MKSCNDDDAITYWNDANVKSRAKIEKESTKGLLHGGRNAARRGCTTVNPMIGLTHPVSIKHLYFYMALCVIYKYDIVNQSSMF